jgi:hypothetical protein
MVLLKTVMGPGRDELRTALIASGEPTGYAGDQKGLSTKNGSDESGHELADGQPLGSTNTRSTHRCE